MATTRTSSAGKVSFGSWESEEREHPQGCSFFCALSSARGFCSPKGLLFYFSRTVRECALRGIFSFSKENIPLTPPRERISIASEQLEELQCLPIAPLACGKAAFTPAIRLGVLLSSAAALPISRWYSLISVYRSTHQCGERSNAAFRRQSAANLTSLAPHDSKARLQIGHELQGFMAKPCTPHLHCAARAVLQD